MSILLLLCIEADYIPHNLQKQKLYDKVRPMSSSLCNDELTAYFDMMNTREPEAPQYYVHLNCLRIFVSFAFLISDKSSHD